jgi:hypothetical protein
VKPIKSYRFESCIRRFSSSVERYRNYPSFKNLNAMIVLLDSISKRLDEAKILDGKDSRTHLILTGWAAPEALKLLNSSNLRKLNPNSIVSIERKLTRHDVMQAHGKRFKDLGFKVIVSSSKDEKIRLFYPKEGIYPSIYAPPSYIGAERKIVVGAEKICDANLTGSRSLVSIDEISSIGSMDITPLQHDFVASIMRSLSGSVYNFLYALRYARHDDLSALLSSMLEGDLRDKFQFLSSRGTPISSSPWKAVATNCAFDKAMSYATEEKVKFPIFESLGQGLRQSIPSDNSVSPAERGIIEFHNSILQFGGTIYSSGELMVVDRAADPRNEIVSGQTDHIFSSPVHGDRALVKFATSENSPLDCGALLSSRNDNNWYHWVVETLPRAILIDKQVDPSVPFVVSSRVPESGIQALKLISTRRIHRVDETKKTSIGLLFTPYPAASIRDSTIMDWEHSIRMDVDSLLELKNAMEAQVSESRFPQRVFLQRNSPHRSITNETQLARIANEFEFEVIDSSKLNFIDQLNLFHHSSFLTGATGAIMANYLFLKPKTVVLGLTSRLNATSVLPSLICQISSAQYFSLEGKDQSQLLGDYTKLHSSFRISPSKFKSAISYLQDSQFK